MNKAPDTWVMPKYYGRICRECEKEFGPYVPEPNERLRYGWCRRHLIAAKIAHNEPTDFLKSLPDGMFGNDRSEEEQSVPEPAEPEADWMIEAMNRRDFLRRLGIGGAAAVAAPALLAKGLAKAAPAAAAAAPVAAQDGFLFYDLMDAAEARFFELLKHFDSFGKPAMPVYIRLGMRRGRYADKDEFYDRLWDHVSSDIEDIVDDGIKNGATSIKALDEPIWDRAVEVLDRIDRVVDGFRTDRTWQARRLLRQRAKRQNYKKWQQRQQAEWKRKRRKVYTSRQPQDRRGMDQPHAPYQGQPRTGEAQNAERVVNRLLETV